MNLETYITKINLEADAKSKAEPGSIYSHTAPVKHWNDQGIFTISQYETYQDQCMCYEMISDLYSKSYARQLDIYNMSAEVVAKTIEEYRIHSETKFVEDMRMEKLRTEKFEQLVADMLEAGAGDRDTAIRWICQAESITTDDLRHGGGYLTYHFDLPSAKYGKEFEKVANSYFDMQAA
jgi:hypothetical protein|tara:strand:+ start:91 stop:627 length:537 start_codon:yes stop_codon:yes gene_type:complete